MSFNAVVQALAVDVILGTIAAMIGLDSIMPVTIGPVLVGALIGAVISFPVAATVLFLVLRAVARFRRRHPVPDEPALEPEDVVLLHPIRDLLAEPRGCEQLPSRARVHAPAPSGLAGYCRAITHGA